MRKVIILLLLAVAGFVGAEYWVGQQIEQALPAFLQRAEQLSQCRIELTTYERGLFQSEAQTTVTFKGDAQAQLVLRHRIWHGPLPFGQGIDGIWHLEPAAAIIETTIPDQGDAPGSIRALLEILPGFADLHGLTVVAYSGAATARADLPAFEQQFEHDGTHLRFSWGGLTANKHFSNDLSKIDGDAHLAGLTLASSDGTLSLSGLTTTYRIFEESGGLLLGNVTLGCDEISSGAINLPPELRVSGFQLRNAASRDGDFASYAVEIAVDKLESPELTFAPAGFELVFSRLDAKTILAVQRRLQNLQTDLVAPGSDFLRDVLAIYLEALPDLLQQQPEIRLNYLRAQTADGELWAKGNLTLGNAAAPLQSFADLVPLIAADGETEISTSLLLSIVRRALLPELEAARAREKGLSMTDEAFEQFVAEQVQQRVDALLTQGLLSREGESFRATFSFRQGQALLNGQPLQAAPRTL